ncbi:MAG: 30S ribosomal protein S9 [Flavobacteriaceae bacterium]|nr:30S ribosomal protein S9 [Flavobacteriaceae bacterium]|tara:strand:+ start:49972 stop:50358 length:387 start_codon:yes stop_codon:yes gene_type:complete
METVHTIGRRKTSVARVYIDKGKGVILVNKKKFNDYFATPSLQYKVSQPFILTNTEKDYDIKITVKGGGTNGQAEAIRLGISRALCKINEEYRPVLKTEGLLTRDPRMVERKKYGQKKARKKFQFSKR